MHPEIESELRENARIYLAEEVQNRGLRCRACEAGIISFDDLYFLGTLNSAEKLNLDTIAETDSNRKEKPNDLIKKVEKKTLSLVAELYNVSSESVERRYWELQAKTIEYFKKLCK